MPTASILLAVDVACQGDPRRLSLGVGMKETVRAAWLRFPSLALEPLEQTYTRLTMNRYRYESAGGQFRTDLVVDDFGFVRDYGGYLGDRMTGTWGWLQRTGSKPRGVEKTEGDPMSAWRHLFLDGEFSPRSSLLSGLTLEQVMQRPSLASHSIYEELWHLTKWQTIVVQRDEAGADAWLSGGPHYPEGSPDREEAWAELVKEFLSGAEKAVAWGESPEGLATKVDAGWAMGEVLQSLAVHNAYHLGKIVALRQRIGAWPPATA